MTKIIGVEDREVSVAVQKFKDSALGQVLSIFLFDSANLGAGYVDQIPANLSRVIDYASQLFDCPDECDNACHACLVSWDSQHRSENLERFSAKKWLDNWAQYLKLPNEYQYFGDGSVAELRTVDEALRVGRFEKAGCQISIFIGEDPNQWDTPNWELLGDILRWATEGTQIRIILNKDAYDKLNDPQRRFLTSLLDVFPGRVTIHLRKADNSVGEDGKFIAILEANKWRVWPASEASLIPGQNWASSESVIVSGLVSPMNLPLAELSSDDFLIIDQVGEAKAQHIHSNITSECDGPINSFGGKDSGFVFLNYYQT